jgi:hypothetical protein
MVKKMLHPTVPLDDSRRAESPGWVRRALTVGALVAAATVATSVYANRSPEGVMREDAAGSKEAQAIEKSLAEKIQSGEANIENTIVVLGSGARFRSEPARITGSYTNPVTEKNVVYEVAEGDSVVIDRPVIIADDDGERWAGVNLKVGQVNTDDGTELESTFAWVNLSAIKKQAEDSGDPSLYGEFAYSYSDVSEMGSSYQSTTENGTITGFVNPASGTELSSAFTMPASEAIEFAQKQVS